MFLRLLVQSFRRQRRRKALAATAIALGVTVATAMLIVATDIGDKMNRELRSYGANLVVFPAADSLDVEIGGINHKPATLNAYLRESDLPRIKTIFWKHNIVGFAPMLPVRMTLRGREVELLGTYLAKRVRVEDEIFTEGVRRIYPWWRVDGEWPNDDAAEIVVGERLAGLLGWRRGSRVLIGGQSVSVTGILSTGGAEDDKVVAPLWLAQRLAARPGAVARIYVSALTTPENELARRDPSTMTPDTYERWYCTPYVQSIAKQLQEAIPDSKAEQLRQVAQNEGRVLTRIRGLMLLVSAAALLASALAVSAAMATTILERKPEIGLMKAIGAGHAAVATLLFVEAGLVALFGGSAGFGFGVLLARQIARMVFDARIEIAPMLYPLVVIVAVAVTFAGSVSSIRRAMQFDPAIVLRGDA